MTKKYTKAINILSKLILRMKENNHSDLSEVELIYMKALLETGEYEKAITMLKNLTFRYPDNLVYRYNFGVSLKMKAESILNNSTSKVKESQEAKFNLEKAIPLLEAVNKIRKEKKVLEYQETQLNTYEFTYKINDLVDICKSLLKSSVKKIEEDKIREEKELKVLEENARKYQEMLLNKHQLEKEEYDKILKKKLDNELKYLSYKEKAQEIIVLRNDNEETKKKGAKKKKKNEREEEDYASYDQEVEKPSKPNRRSKKKKMKRDEMDLDDDEDNEDFDPLKDMDIEGMDEKESLGNASEGMNEEVGEEVNIPDKNAKKKPKKLKKLKRMGEDNDLGLKEGDSLGSFSDIIEDS
mmetsp:Transcript_36197/g.37567  ORF Transcript_36197/g.37567 Transcript_36197/m.37567 type:complete len:354 (+) Transcript_36197:246-1307(+)